MSFGNTSFSQIRQSKLDRLENILSYTFKNPLLALESIQLPGNNTVKIDGHSIPDGNKRLAIVGDLAMDLVLAAKSWYPAGQGQEVWTQIRLTITSNSNLAAVGRRCGLEMCMEKSLTNPQPMSDKMFATAMEAVLGAVYVDSGYDLQICEDVMTHLGLCFNL